MELRGRGGKATRRRGRRGQALVEASLVMPILLLVVMIGVDFGRLYASQVTVADAARQAARYGAANPADQSVASVCGSWGGSVSTAQQEASGSPVSIACQNVAVSSAGPDSYGAPFVTASVSAPFSFVTPFLTPLLHIDHVSSSDTARELNLNACASSCCVVNCVPSPTPTPNHTYAGEAWAAATTGVATANAGGVGLVARADARVGDTGALPSGGGSVTSGPLATFSIPNVLNGTVAVEQANGSNGSGSASSSVASVTILPGQAPGGADVADITTAVDSTGETCGATPNQSSSLASLKIAGNTVPIPNGTNQVVTLTGVATVYFNTVSPNSNPPTVEVLRIVFPGVGTLSTQITGTVTVAHAQQSCS